MTKRKTPKAPPAVPARFSINWPPGFVSAIRVDPRTKRFETDFARSQRCRDGGGWNSHTISQPGNVAYVAAGPVQMMRRAV